MVSQPCLVLVVEDDEDSFDVIEAALRHYKADIVVCHASNGREGVEMLRKKTPQLVVMDLDLPELDGWQALKLIRDDPATAHVPVVAVTAYGSVRVASDVIYAGFNAYIPKPIDIPSFGEELLRLIEHE